MRNLYILICCLFMMGLTAFGQLPGIQWQKPFGGSDAEAVLLLHKTSDNGSVMLVKNNSVNGDFAAFPNSFVVVKINNIGYTEWKRPLALTAGFLNIKSSIITANDELYILGEVNNDIWVGKISSAGTLLWQRSYGGIGVDVAGSFTRDANGDLLVVGSVPNATGDITGPFRGFTDIWIFKINAAGTMLWNKCYGGSLAEFQEQAIIKPVGNDFVVLTETLSNDGDATGHHGNSWDIWAFKINGSGVIQWQTQLGGNEIEISRDIVETPAGEFYISGYSYSFAMPNFHIGSNSDPDIYVAKITAAGIFVSQKCFGGNFNDRPVALFAEDDGGCVLFAEVTVINGNNGDILGFSGSYDEIWAFKMNTSWNIAWQRCLGGNSQDDAIVVTEEKYDDNNNLLPDTMRSYVMLARTLSNSRDVVGFHSNGSQPGFDMWLTKMKKSDRTLLWSRCLGSKGSEYPTALIRKNNNEYLVGGSADGNDGDVIGQHFAGQGYSDAWIVKFGPANLIKGIVYLDLNSNGIKEPAEKLLSNASIKSEKPGDTRISVSTGGRFQNDADTGTYISTIVSNLPYYTSSLASRQSVFTSYGQKDSFAFPIVPIPGHYDLKVYMVPVDPARTNLNTKYIAYCTNSGTEILNNVTLKVIKDHRIAWNGALPGASSIINDSAWWNIATIAPFDTIKFEISFKLGIPPALQFGDRITSYAMISSSQPDETPTDNADTVTQVVIGSYDPNDKKEKHGGEMTFASAVGGSKLGYTIRFQNTGTDTAFNIIIRDTLDNKLDWNSVEMITTSHTCQLSVKDGNILTWTFPNIRLVDSTHNEPASHGYISFQLKAKPTVLPGDTIKNSVSIYFDFNLPVQTNIEKTRIVTDSLVCPGSSAVFRTATAGESYQWQVDNGTGFTNISNDIVYSGATNNMLLLSSPSTNMNRYKYRCLVTTGGIPQYSNVYTLRFGVVWNGTISSAWENPANWNCGVIPDDKTEVVILPRLNNPELNTDQFCYSLSLRSSSSVIIKPGVTLTITAASGN